MTQPEKSIEEIAAEIAARRGCSCRGQNGCGCFNMALRAERAGITVEQALDGWDNEWPLRKGAQ